MKKMKVRCLMNYSVHIYVHSCVVCTYALCIIRRIAENP